MRVSTPSLAVLCSFVTSGLALWPAPTHQTNGTTVLCLDPSRIKTSYAPRGYDGRRRSANTASDFQLISDAFDRFMSNVVKTAYVPWKFYPRGTNFENASRGRCTYVSSIAVKQVASNSSSTNTTSVDESYTLDLSTDGKTTIKAATANGAMHALTSLQQLFYKTSDGLIYTNLAPVSVRDAPKYSYRGLNLDIARNWQTPSDVKRLMDAMELNKFNVLHIHATDAQSWPLEIPALPELSAKGAYYRGLTWTPQDLRSVQQYAVARGIQPIIEIDSPGHLSSVAYSHPDLITAFNVQPWGNDCAEPPCGEIKLNSPAVYSFFDKLYGDLLPRVKPFTTRFHSGGDEVNANAYLLDNTVNSKDPAVLQPLLQKFVSHLQSKVLAAGLSPMAWEEMIVTWNLTLSPKTLVQTWTGQESLAAVTGLGYKALFGDYFHWYLDCGYGQWLDPNTSAIAAGASPITPPYTDYCSPLKSWREIYSYDPTANLTAPQRALLEGGEVHMWGELTDPVNLDSKVWPRASAAAEIMWSGVTGFVGVDEGVMRRLADLRERLVGWGYRANPVSMTWCLQNEGDCTL